MSNETKRDVFEVAMNHATKSGWIDYSEMMSRYDAALPEDLPVIPECVNCAIEWFKQNDDDLGEVFRNAYEDLVDDWHECPQLEVAETWIINCPDEFARAWLDGYEVEVNES